jgi:hypothetical protein
MENSINHLILQSSSSNFCELLINGLCIDIPQRQHPLAAAAAAAVEGGSAAAATFPGVPTPTDQQPTIRRQR